MAIDKVLPWEKVQVQKARGFNAILHWLDQQGLKVVDDFLYGGDVNKEAVAFSFKDKNSALLFKLTWGGE